MIVAKYFSPLGCSECGGDILVGQEILPVADGPGWVHVECPDGIEVGTYASRETYEKPTRFTGTSSDEMGY